jgi:hypothetical protein
MSLSRHNAASKARPYRDALKARIDEFGRRSSRPRRETLLKQYELIRSEIMTSLQVQQQILGFGIATVGLLAGAAFVGQGDRLRSQLLVVFLPLVAYLAVTIWFSEVMRMLRAGGYLLTLEKKLDKHGDGSLDWEYQVAKGRHRHAIGKPYFGILDPDQLRLLAVTLLFFTLAIASMVLGWHDASNFTKAFAIGASIVAVAVLGTLFHLRIRQLGELLEVPPEVYPLPRFWNFMKRDFVKRVFLDQARWFAAAWFRTVSKQGT